MPPIRIAVQHGEFVVSEHAQERLEERGAEPWQVEVGLAEAVLLREDLSAHPNPKIVVAQSLADGTACEAVWSYKSPSKLVVLVTVYFKTDG